MKKLLFAFVALAAMSFASCGNAEKGAAQDSDTVVTQDTDTVAQQPDTNTVVKPDTNTVANA